MKYEYQVSVEFDAGHVVGGDLRCSVPHGHHWVCTATIISSGAAAMNMPLRVDMEQVRRELDRRNLNDMLAGTIPTVVGVANWLWDRLIMAHELLEVSVAADGTTAFCRK